MRIEKGIEVWEKVGVDEDGKPVFDVHIPVTIYLPPPPLEHITVQLVRQEDLEREP